jgi:hypothetical protein
MRPAEMAAPWSLSEKSIPDHLLASAQDAATEGLIGNCVWTEPLHVGRSAALTCDHARNANQTVRAGFATGLALTFRGCVNILPHAYCVWNSENHSSGNLVVATLYFFVGFGKVLAMMISSLFFVGDQLGRPPHDVVS